ncbi:MAG: hypothetical protein HRT38_14430 [Alteromonadaceae bacterium]|nr:hypothetical protein [Alteromonadaceae bacterium]
MKKFMTMILLLFCVNAHSDQTTGLGKVTEIWSGYSSGMILFKLDIPFINPNSCSSGAYSVDATKADVDKFLSMLLTAQSRQASVQIIISDTACYGGYATALRMGIRS